MKYAEAYVSTMHCERAPIREAAVLAYPNGSTLVARNYIEAMRYVVLGTRGEIVPDIYAAESCDFDGVDFHPLADARPAWFGHYDERHKCPDWLGLQVPQHICSVRDLGAGRILFFRVAQANPAAGFPMSLSAAVLNRDGREWNADYWNPMIDPETHQLDPHRPQTVVDLLDAIDERVRATPFELADRYFSRREAMTCASPAHDVDAVAALGRALTAMITANVAAAKGGAA